MIARRARKRRAWLLLLPLNAALAAFLWIELNRPDEALLSPMSTAPPPSAATAAMTLPQELPPLPPLTAFRSVAERPLFHPTRRPIEAPTPPPPPPPAAEPVAAVAVAAPLEPLVGYTLRGVMIDADGRIAILEPASGGPYLRVVEGDALEGWLLAEVTRERAVFEQLGEQTVFELRPPSEAAGGFSAQTTGQAPPPAAVEDSRGRRRQ